VTTRSDDEYHSCIFVHTYEAKPGFIWLRLESGHNHPNIEDLAEIGLDEDRLKQGFFE
jgi:hypothetical protein